MGVTDTTGTCFHGVVAGAPEPVVPQPVIKAPKVTRKNQGRRMDGLEMILSIELQRCVAFPLLKPVPAEAQRFRSR